MNHQDTTHTQARASQELLLDPSAAEHSRTLTPAGAELLPSASACSVSIGVVRGLVEAVERAGVSRSRFLAAASLPSDLLDALEARIPLAQIQQLCELAVSETCDPALGLHWAGWLSERMFVPVSHLIAHSKSLRHGFELLAQFFPLLCDHAAYRVVETDQQVVVQRLNGPGESTCYRRFNAEIMVGGFWRLIATFSGFAVPGHACFEHAPPPEQAEYQQFFGRAVAFEQRFTGVVFDRALLDASAPQKDEGVLEALQQVAERRMLRINRSAPYALRVRELVVSGFREGTDMQRTARALDMSARSLRRHLLAEGKSYNDVINEALSIVATRLLRDDRRTIQEVAYELGFSEMSAFYRAFKRWTGTTPRAWREQQRV